MVVEIHSHAYKHGLSEKQILSAYASGELTARVRSRDSHVEPTRWALIGFDDAGRAVELLFIKTASGVLIFHANWLTNGFRKEFKQ